MTIATPTALTEPVVRDQDRYLFDVQGFLHLRGAIAEADRLALLDEVTRQEQLEHDDNRWNPASWGGRPDLPTKMVEGAQIRLNGLLRMSPVFDRCIDYPTVCPYLYDFLPNAQLGNAWSISKGKGVGIGGWHSGFPPADYGFRNGRIHTRSVNTVYFLTDNGPDDGCMTVIPGSHKANIQVDTKWGAGLDLPGAVPVIGKAGDVLVFTESLLHTGLANTSGRRRVNLYYNNASPDFRIPGMPSIAFSYNYAMPPHIRARFTERQKQATEWMAFAKTID
ncbi:MAG: phytanoyl-CoA dioxygenase family protein [Planctomycetes bacterium]|nr:phytanoyl-CoA dioxygenase family protein [Planctomycetota bacterium]